jgi:hypothetical protein
MDSIHLRKYAFVFVLLLSSLLPYCKGEHSEHSSNPTDSITPVTPSKSKVVEIQIKWDYTQIPLKMQIREPSGSQVLALWTTGSIKKGKPAPYGNEISDGKLFLKPGSKKQFLLVMENETVEPVYFFAAPHQALPVEHSFGFKFKCLCVNHAFTVPSKETWYRVVEIRLAPDFLGDQLTLTHNIIGMTKERMSEFEKSATKSMPHEMD